MIPTAVQPVVQLSANDCGVVALSGYLGIPYREVSNAALTVDPKAHADGLTIREMQKVVKALGRGPLRVGTVFATDERDEATAILVLTRRGRELHYAVLFDGVLINPADGMVWNLDAYLETKQRKIRSFLYEDSITR